MSAEEMQYFGQLSNHGARKSEINVQKSNEPAFYYFQSVFNRNQLESYRRRQSMSFRPRTPLHSVITAASHFGWGTEGSGREKREDGFGSLSGLSHTLVIYHRNCGNACSRTSAALRSVSRALSSRNRWKRASSFFNIRQKRNAPMTK